MWSIHPERGLVQSFTYRNPAPLTQIERFVPPDSNDTPGTLFAHRGTHRFIRHSNDHEILLYADGACLNNGAADPKAGCAFIFRPAAHGVNNHVKFRLELQGPTGIAQQQTSNRAELRAVIGALNFRAWSGEGWERIVIATDSTYIVNGCTRNIWIWRQNGWRTARGTPVKNRDLWEKLFERIKELHVQGSSVLFWWIPRELNTLADSAARTAASDPDVAKYTGIEGIMC